jgi:nitrogen regulatory protein PII
MFFVLYVLHDETKLTEVLDAWDEAGVTGVTVLPSTGMGRIIKYGALREDIPIIPSLQALIKEHEEILNRTLFSIVESEEVVQRIVENTEKVVGPLSDPNTGILAVLPVLKVYGLRNREDHEKRP